MVKILIVDDELDIRKSLRRFLEKEKHTVTEARDGLEALKILQKKKFDLVLLDILMPNMTGIEVGKSIRANLKTKNQIMVFCSVVALGDEGTKQVRAIHPEYFLNKPFELKKLREVILQVTQTKKNKVKPTAIKKRAGNFGGSSK
jgi:CheY-like chemotaxis protein